MAFTFETLPVYQKAIAWAQSAETLCSTLKRSASRALAERLSQSALSISSNIAEGNGRWRRNEKRQHLWASRGALLECVAIVEVLYKCELIGGSDHTGYHAQLEELAKMINALIKSLEQVRPALSSPHLNLKEVSVV